MEQNTENKIEIRDKLIIFYNKNKGKIFTSILIILIILFTFLFIEQNNKKKIS